MSSHIFNSQYNTSHRLSVSGQTLSCDDLTFTCAIGRSGVGYKEKEGDGLTPIGEFPFRFGLYRSDRLERPISNLPFFPLDKSHGWCDDSHDINYNRLIHLPYDARHEELYRQDNIYDIILILGYNDNPVIPDKGSAIFMHIARENYSPTAGCIALTPQDLLKVCARLTSRSVLDIKSAF